MSLFSLSRELPSMNLSQKTRWTLNSRTTMFFVLCFLPAVKGQNLRKVSIQKLTRMGRDWDEIHYYKRPFAIKLQSLSTN